jgi:hypothetical protein
MAAAQAAADGCQGAGALGALNRRQLARVLGLVAGSAEPWERRAPPRVPVPSLASRVGGVPVQA